MNELFAVGFAAGLALAIPLGPIGIMIVGAGIERGWRHSAAAALGAATVDGLYALATFVVGSAISTLLAKFSTYLGLAGAIVLLVIGLQILVRNIRLLSAPGDQPIASKSGSTPIKTYALFVTAVAINPPTAIYFLSIAPSVGALASNEPLIGSVVFAIGAFVGSILWGQTLAVVGVALRKVAGTRVRAILGVIGGALIVVLAFALAAQNL